jgi:hypothetical protein
MLDPQLWCSAAAGWQGLGGLWLCWAASPQHMLHPPLPCPCRVTGRLTGLALPTVACCQCWHHLTAHGPPPTCCQRWPHLLRGWRLDDDPVLRRLHRLGLQARLQRCPLAALAECVRLHKPGGRGGGGSQPRSHTRQDRGGGGGAPGGGGGGGGGSRQRVPQCPPSRAWASPRPLPPPRHIVNPRTTPEQQRAPPPTCSSSLQRSSNTPR